VCYSGYNGDDCSTGVVPGWAWFIIEVSALVVLVLAILFITKKLHCPCSKRPADYELLNNE
jgi:hypothetical protein